MEISIREAKLEDGEELAKLVVQFRDEHSRLLNGNCTAELQDVLQEVRSNLQKESSGYFVAEPSKNQLIGYRSWEYRDGYYFTKELFVRPDYRKEGVARELIRTMEEWLLEQGQHSACISCVPQNLVMIQLARSEGYKIFNRIEMRKNLSEKSPEPSDKLEALGYRWEVF
ncbi:MAG: GNAT family N-acetyltransferase [Candidatus Bipolaricaulota bacterium]